MNQRHLTSSVDSPRAAAASLMASSSSDEPALALPAPTTAVDALPYVDAQYNDPAMKRQVDALVEAEMRTFTPGDYLGHLPASYEPNFEVRAPVPTAARLAAAGTRPSHAARPLACRTTRCCKRSGCECATGSGCRR